MTKRKAETCCIPVANINKLPLILGFCITRPHSHREIDELPVIIGRHVRLLSKTCILVGSFGLEDSRKRFAYSSSISAFHVSSRYPGKLRYC